MGALLGKLCGKRASKAERLERIAGKERERQLARRAKARARRVKREERAAEIKARGGGALGLCKRAATAGGDAGDSDKVSGERSDAGACTHVRTHTCAHARARSRSRTR